MSFDKQTRYAHTNTRVLSGTFQRPTLSGRSAIKRIFKIDVRKIVIFFFFAKYSIRVFHFVSSNSESS